MACTTQQIQFFKENGFLIIKNMIEPKTLETWRNQIWSHFDSCLETPETWPNDRQINDFKFDHPENAFGRLPQIGSVVAQLSGGEFANADGSPLFIWPSPPGTEWIFPHTRHVDGWGTSWYPFMLGVTTYLYDVESRGGGFAYWPRSHLTTHSYFLEDPARIDGRFKEEEGWSNMVFSDRAPEGPREFTGRAGDVIFWHSFLVHSASINVRSEPRFAMLVRFTHIHQEEIKYDVPDNLWKYWAI